MNIERRIEELEEYVKQVDSSFKLTNSLIGIFNNPDEMRRLLSELTKGADVMAEIKGKTEQMDKRIDDSQKWMQFHSRALLGIGIVIIGLLISIVVALWKMIP